MKNYFKNQTGAIDLILILVVFVLAAGLGGYVYYRQQQANKAYNSAGQGTTVATHKKTAKKPATLPSSVNTYNSAPMSFNYPASWKEVGAGSDPTLDTAISNEGKGAPLEGDNNHIFLTLQHTSGSSLDGCFVTNLNKSQIKLTKTMTISGLPGKRYLVNATPAGGESTYAAVYTVLKSETCFSFEFQSLVAKTRDEGLPGDDTIIGSVKLK